MRADIVHRLVVLAVGMTVCLAGLCEAQAAPANDAFANRITITGMTNTVTGSNVGATREAGEPIIFGNGGGASVWWTWTAPTNGLVTIDTIGSSFDTILGIYTGSSVASLTLVASDDDSGGSRTSLTSFPGVVGTVYQIAVDGFNGDSGNIVLHVSQAPPIPPGVTVSVANTNATAGTDVLFTTTVTGDPPFGFRWYFAGGLIAGANTNSLVVTNIQFNQAGVYQCVVTNSAGAATNSITLNVVPPMPPSVTVAPVSATDVAGDFVTETFTATATGSDPLRFQWYFGSTLIAGETNSLLYVTGSPFQLNQSGTYRVVVTNAYGKATNSATLSVVPLIVTVSPASTNIFPGSNATFTADVTSNDPTVRYQWYFAGAPISGATTNTFTVTNAQFSSAGAYQIVATNSYGAATNAGTLNVLTQLSVVITNDDGAGSLRQAILYANSHPGVDTITFNLPAGTNTISLASSLPPITEAVVIDGTSQPGYAGRPLVFVDSGGHSFGPLVQINSGGSTIKGLGLGGAGTFNTPGDAISIKNGGSNVIAGCYLGLTTAGTGLNGNQNSCIYITNSVGNRIGGVNLADRNVIAGVGYTSPAVILDGPGTSNNVIQGNILGLDPTGTNFTAFTGLLIQNANSNTIGGASATARNVMIGGVQVYGTATGNLVQSNYIGTTITGGVVPGLPLSGITGVAIGGPSNSVLGNVISGNRGYGILMDRYSGNPSGNLIQGNFIGTGPTGTNRVPNGNGVYVDGTNNVIGGVTAAARNVISGNTTDNIDVGGDLNVVQGNFIGTDITGLARLLGGAAATNGMVIGFGHSNVIGGLVAGQRNVIAGDNGVGVNVNGALNDQIIGNYIGLGADGSTILGSGSRGLVEQGDANSLIASNLICGARLDGILINSSSTLMSNNLFLANTIFNNGSNGFTLTGPNPNYFGSILDRNSIFGNGGIAIDRGGDGPTTNDPNAFSAVNNYPVLTNVTVSGGVVTISGSLRADVGKTYRIQFFFNPPTDTRPQARTFIGETNITISQATSQTRRTAGGRVRPLTGTSQGTVGVTASFTAPVTPGCTFTACSGTSGGQSECGPLISVSPPVSANVTTGGNGNSGSDAEPVNTFNGELFNTMPPDLALSGPMPLRFFRYYAALLKRDSLIAGKLGDNWLHNFEWTLATTSSNTVRIVNSVGRLIEFTNTGSAFVLLGRQDIPFQLATSGGNYILGSPRSQMIYTFNATGQLIQISDGHGNAHQLTYTGTQLTSVSDGLGRALTFSYNVLGALTNITDGARSVAFTQTGNNLTSVRDALSNVWSYAYDLTNANPGLMIAWTNPVGNVPFSQVFDAQGRVISQTDGGQFTTTFGYTNNTTYFTDPRGNTRAHVHDASGNFMNSTDEAGLSLSLGYNAAGQRSAVTDRLGDTIGIGYHAPSGKLSAITNADGTVTAYTYSARTNNSVAFYDVSQVTYPDGTVESFTRDANGNVLTRTDRAGKVWTFTYNTRGQVLTARNPTSGTATFTYDAGGNLATRTDSDTGLVTFAYDQFSRLTNIIHPDSTTMRMVWDANDRLVSTTDERGNTTTFSYDNNGNLVQVTDALGRASGFAYDARDRMIRSTNRLGQVSSRGFGPLDQLVSVTNRNGFVTTFSYDARRRMTSVTDPGGKTWSTGYDNEDIPVAFTNPLNQTSRTATDQLGYPASGTNALGHVTRVVRDAMRRVTATVDGINRTNNFSYDARGLLASATKPVIGAANYARSDLGRLTRITDQKAGQWNFAQTVMGRSATVSDPLNRSQTMTYDNRGRLARIAYADGVTCTNTFDAANNLTRRQYSDGTDLPFTYDALNRLVTANSLAFSYDAEGRLTNTASSGVNYSATYDAGRRLTSASYNNGAFTVNYAYDSRNRLTNVTDTLTGTSVSFAYDDAGRMTNLTRANGVNGTYTYDAAGRLTRIQEGSIIDLQFGLDAARQITTINSTAPLDPAGLHQPNLKSYSYDAAHQINSPGHSYDASGRQTALPGHTFQWDGASRLKQIDAVTLAYDGLNNLQTRTASGVTLRYFYNHAIRLAPIMAERNDTTSQMQRYYVWTPGGKLLYAIDPANGNAVSHYHFDQVGSTLALTAANGSVTDAYAYTPYGVLLGHTGTSTQPFTYVGRYGVRAEPAANLSQMRARYYDPVSSRFLSRDRRWPRLNSPLELNPYDYSSRRPLQFIDPMGSDSSTIIGPGTGSTTGAGQGTGSINDLNSMLRESERQDLMQAAKASVRKTEKRRQELANDLAGISGLTWESPPTERPKPDSLIGGVIGSMDNAQDVVALNRGAGSVIVGPGLGASAPWSGFLGGGGWSGSVGLGGANYVMSVADFNADGSPDIIGIDDLAAPPVPPTDDVPQPSDVVPVTGDSSGPIDEVF